MGKNEAGLDDKPKLNLTHNKWVFIQISGHFEHFCCGTNMELTTLLRWFAQKCVLIWILGFYRLGYKKRFPYEKFESLILTMIVMKC